MTPPPPDPAKKLADLLKTLRAVHGEPQGEPWLPPSVAQGDPLVGQLIFSFLLWESRPTLAADAFERLSRSMADANELRVCLPDEIAAAAGDESPLALERAARLRSALNDLYRRFHGVTLEPLAGMNKRDARLSIAAIEGVTPFVAARVALLSLGGHAFPLDRRLHEALESESAAPAGVTTDEAINWLERHFRAGEAAPAYLVLEAWMDARTPPPPPCDAPGQGPAAPPLPDTASKQPKRSRPTARKAPTSTPAKRTDA